MSHRCQAAVVIALLFLAATTTAQQSPTAPSAPAPSGPQRGLQTVTEEGPVKNGHQYVVAIGIDHYQNWPVLGTAVSDATGFANLLTSKFGFEYAVEPLTEKNATRDAINSLIDDDLRRRLKPEDDLIIFFAGHGTTRNDTIGDTTRSVGFIVPVDARAPGANEHWSDYLNVEELLRNVSTLPASHILVILDSCHSGMALGSKFSTSRDDNRFQRDMLVKVSRKVISSAQGDQLAADSGPLANHSLFTGLMIQGLTTGNADSFGGGFVTASQLGAFAQHQVGVAEGSRQTPLFGAFDLDEGGELIIHLGAGATPATAADAANPATTMTRYETNELARLKSDKHYWRDDDPLKNFPAARSASLKLCDSGDGWGCFQAGRSFQSGLGGGSDYSRAVNLAQQACRSHVSDGCVLLGDLDASGETIEPDMESAAHLYQNACTEGNLHGCIGIGRLYLDGHGIEKDYTQAKSLFTKVCDGGEMVGCNNLGAIYENALGVPRDYGQALSWWQKACDGGFMKSCEIWAVPTFTAPASPKTSRRPPLSFARAAQAAKWIVAANLAGCINPVKESTKTRPSQSPFYRKACDNGSAFGCRNLGNDYGNGEGVPKTTHRRRFTTANRAMQAMAAPTVAITSA